MRSAVRLYFRLISIQIRSQMQYRVSFLVEGISQAFILLTYFLGLALVFERFQSIGGWSLGEVAFLWGLVEAAFGVMDILFSGFDPSSFSPMIQRGAFDQLLLRPRNITLQVLGSKFMPRRLGRICEGLVIFGYAISRLDIQWTMGKVLYLPVIFASMIAFFGGLFIIGATFTFWTVQPVEAVNIFTYGGTELMSYPMHIYPNWIRTTFTYIVPAIFLNYYPAIYILGKTDPLGFPAFAPFLAPLAGAVVMAAALTFWRFGIRHYQGTGS